jgi:hypothetical protein
MCERSSRRRPEGQGATVRGCGAVAAAVEVGAGMGLLLLLLWPRETTMPVFAPLSTLLLVALAPSGGVCACAWVCPEEEEDEGACACVSRCGTWRSWAATWRVAAGAARTRAATAGGTNEGEAEVEVLLVFSGDAEEALLFELSLLVSLLFDSEESSLMRMWASGNSSGIN